MKRTLLITLCLLIVIVTAFAGCTNGDTVEESDETTTDETVDTTEVTDSSNDSSEDSSEDTGEFDPSDYHIGIVTYPSSNTTIAVWVAGFMQTAEELGFKGLYIGGDTTDPATVEQMIDSAIAQYDNLVGVAIPINSETRWNMAKKFTDAGIYVVSGWTPISVDDYETNGIDGDYVLGYHATDSYTYGYEAGIVMGEACNGAGTVAVTQNSFNDTEDEAARGFTEAITEKYPDMIVLDPQVESADVTQGISVVTSLIQANFGELVGAFGTTGTSPQSWSTAAESTGWEGVIIGMDATSANLDILESGGVYAIVAQPMYDAWSECAKHLSDSLTGANTYEYDNFVESPIIYADDAEEYRDLLKGVDTYADFK